MSIQEFVENQKRLSELEIKVARLDQRIEHLLKRVDNLTSKKKVSTGGE